MENPAPNNPGNAQPASPAAKAKPPQPSTLPEFIAAGGNAHAFLRKLKKSAFSIPSPDDVRQMAQRLVALPNGAPRVLNLLQALDEAVGSIRESILGLAEAFLCACGAIPTSSAPLTPPECRLAIERLLRPDARDSTLNCGWIARIIERFVRPAVPKGPRPNLDLFGICLLLAFHRGWLAEDDVFALLARACSVPKQKHPRSAEAQVEPSAIGIILGSPLKKPGLPVLLALHAAWRKRATAAAERIHQLESTVARLESESAQLTEKLTRASSEIAGLKSTVRENDQRIAALTQELTDTRTAAQHRHDTLKGRVRGFLEGDLSRWLQNATEAANIEPARVRVIQERLQSALGGIQKEAQWLQSSD